MPLRRRAVCGRRGNRDAAHWSDDVTTRGSPPPPNLRNEDSFGTFQGGPFFHLSKNSTGNNDPRFIWSAGIFNF